ncbi:MAG: hypothetical protein ACT4RN_14065 [Pseudonocardia sp.]
MTPHRAPASRSTSRDGAAPASLHRRLHAAWHGMRDGRLGLTVEQAAEAPFLVRLHARTAADADAADRALDDALAVITWSIRRGLGDTGDLLARRAALVERAEVAARRRERRYREITAWYGRAFLRHHRDRRVVRLGWRAPPLPGEPQPSRTAVRRVESEEES